MPTQVLWRTPMKPPACLARSATCPARCRCLYAAAVCRPAIAWAAVVSFGFIPTQSIVPDAKASQKSAMRIRNAPLMTLIQAAFAIAPPKAQAMKVAKAVGPEVDPLLI